MRSTLAALVLVGCVTPTPPSESSSVTTDTGTWMTGTTTWTGTGPGSLDIEILVEDTSQLRYDIEVSVNNVLVEAGQRTDWFFELTSVAPGQVRVEMLDGSWEDQITSSSSGYTGLNGQCHLDCTALAEAWLRPGDHLSFVLEPECFSFGCD